MAHEIGPYSVLCNVIHYGKHYSLRRVDDPAIIINSSCETHIVTHIGNYDSVEKIFDDLVAAYKMNDCKELVESIKLIRFNSFGLLSVDDICTILNAVVNGAGISLIQLIGSIGDQYIDMDEVHNKIDALSNAGY